jgi:hypothetical protein
MKLLSKDELEKLNTKRLLAYKNKLMKVPEDYYFEDRTKINKAMPEWQETYSYLKAILASREHIE